MVPEMRALSIQQPWICAILYEDKRVENRTWAPPARVIGQAIALHASKGPDWDAPDYAWHAAGLMPYRPGAKRSAWTGSLALGAIVGTARIAGYHPRFHLCNPAGPETVCSRWSAWGECHWLLEDVKVFREPVPCRGALGLWRLPEDVEKAARKQLEAVRHG